MLKSALLLKNSNKYQKKKVKVFHSLKAIGAVGVRGPLYLGCNKWKKEPILLPLLPPSRYMTSKWCLTDMTWRQVHDIKMMSYWRQCEVYWRQCDITLHRRHVPAGFILPQFEKATHLLLGWQRFPVIRWQSPTLIELAIFRLLSAPYPSHSNHLTMVPL